MCGIKLHSRVVIVGTRVDSTVVGVWVDEDECVKFNVRYIDDQRVVRHEWIGAKGLVLNE